MSVQIGLRTKLFALLAAPLFVLPAWADIIPFSEDFEGLDASDPDALSNAGWLIFANVYFDDGSFSYDYGTFPAPNHEFGFSAIATDEGGAEQGAQQLSVFSDYNNGDHAFGDLIEVNVFQEFNVGAADVGNTYTFSFDAKRGNLEGATTAIGFIKTLDPTAGFFTTNFITVEMTSIPADWGRYSLSLEIGEDLVGQIFQVGFSNTASNFEGSGIFYDNIVLVGPADTDGDGVPDSTDNCTTFANADQTDTDTDGFGNACDPDLNQDCNVNFFDLGQFKAGFSPVNDPNADFTNDGFVNFQDLGRMKALFFNGTTPGPGPSGVLNECD